MREKGFSPEPDENAVARPPAPYGGEFMARWLRRRNKNLEVTEDDEDEESEKPKSRFGRLFNKLFQRIAAKEEVQSEKQRYIPLHEFFTPPEPEENSAEEKVAEFPAPEERTSASSQITKEAESEADETVQPDVREKIRESSPAVNRQPKIERTEEPAIIALRNTESEASRPAERTVFERAYETQPIRREQVIERRVAEPLAVLEYFLRRRAVKNVERQAKKETASLEKRLRQSNEATKRLQELTQKSQAQLEQLRTKRETAGNISRPTERIEKVERTAERPIANKPEAVVLPVNSPEKISTTPDLRKDYERKEAVPQPERILQEVAKAAEKNAPIEKAYERRHEIKDEPSTSNSTTIAGGAVPIGALLNQSLQQPLSDGTRKQLTEAARQKTGDTEKNMYRQAVASGFWTALVIVVIITTMVFLGS